MALSRRAFLALSSTALVLPAEGLIAAPAEAAAMTVGARTTLIPQVMLYEKTWVSARTGGGFVLGACDFTNGPQLRYFAGSGAPIDPPVPMPYVRSPNPVPFANGTAMAVFDGENDSVFAQKFDAARQKLDLPIRVDIEATYDYLHDARAVKLANGNVLCAWRHEIAGGASQLRVRVITPAGTPVSAETTIVSGGVINVLLVIALKAGGAVISFGYHDASWNRSERLALVSNLGARVGAVKVLRTNVDTTSESAGLAPLPAGGFVAVWQQEYPAYSGNGRLKGMMFSATMATQKTFYKTLKTGQYQDADVRVAVNSGGRMMVVHTAQTASSTATQRRAFSVAAVLFDLTGKALAGPTLMDTGRYYGPYERTVTALSDKSFYVTWMKSPTGVANQVSLVGRRITVT